MLSALSSHQSRSCESGYNCFFPAEHTKCTSSKPTRHPGSCPSNCPQTRKCSSWPPGVQQLLLPGRAHQMPHPQNQHATLAAAPKRTTAVQGRLRYNNYFFPAEHTKCTSSKPTRHPGSCPSNCPQTRKCSSWPPGVQQLLLPGRAHQVHILKTNTPPWQLPPNAQLQFKATYIPCQPPREPNNSSGSFSCKPGQHLFLAEHTKCHILKTNTSPWQLPPNA
jgi:hypothetical protein